MLGNLLGGFITVLVGANFIGVLANQIHIARYHQDNITTTGYFYGTNVTGVSGTLLGLTTVFFAIAVMFTGISVALSGLRNAGVL